MFCVCVVCVYVYNMNQQDKLRGQQKDIIKWTESCGFVCRLYITANASQCETIYCH